jgi:hypothetical protein
MERSAGKQNCQEQAQQCHDEASLEVHEAPISRLYGLDLRGYSTKLPKPTGVSK